MFYILFAAFLWGTLGVIAVNLNKFGYDGFHVASLRVIFSSFFIVILLIFTFKDIILSFKKSYKILILQSLIGVFSYNVFYFLAIAEIGVIFSVCLLYTSPIWTLLFEKVFYGETNSYRRILLAFFAFIGVVMALNLQANNVSLSLYGVLFGLVAGASYALYYVIGKRVLKDVQPNTLLVSSFTISSLFFLFIPNTWDGLCHLAMERDVIVWVAFLAISLIGTVFSYFLFTWGLRSVSPPTISILTTIEPLTSITLAALLLGETLYPIQWLGMALIVGCNVLTGISSRFMRD